MKAALAVLVAVLIALGLVILIDRGGKFCPEDQVSVLGADRWVCVKEGAKP